jgi:chemotaxis protein MotA
LEILDDTELNNNQFLKKGLILVADNVDALHIKEILTRQSQALTAQYRIAERVFAVSGSFAPMFGMLGTVMGLIAMLGKIQTPDMIPPAMGLALVTTMYGLILAVTLFIPISGKIRDVNHFETDYRELIIEGILAINSNENPLIIKERLMSFLKPWKVKYEK